MYKIGDLFLTGLEAKKSKIQKMESGKGPQAVLSEGGKGRQQEGS